MSNILYYPTIEFREEDYKWLWTASLLWDKVYRIVPDGYEPSEPKIVKELCSSGEIGLSISPQRYSSAVAGEFIEKIESGFFDAAALEFNHDDIDAYREYSRIHQDKIDVSLRQKFLANTAISELDEWLHVPKEMANLYMTYLANNIADRNNLSLFSGNEDVFTASTYFLHDGEMQANLFVGDEYEEPSNKALVSIFLNDLIPENIVEISPKKLLEFRRKRKDERVACINAIQDFIDEISHTEDPDIVKDIISDEKSEIKKAISNYKKSMDMLRITKWTGAVTTAVTLSVDALGYLFPAANIFKPLTTAGISIGLITGILSKKAELNRKPYTYLAEIQSIYPHRMKEYNKYLYNKIEEFIND